MELLWGLNKIIYRKLLAQHLEYNNHLMNLVIYYLLHLQLETYWFESVILNLGCTMDSLVGFHKVPVT